MKKTLLTSTLALSLLLGTTGTALAAPAQAPHEVESTRPAVHVAYEQNGATEAVVPSIEAVVTRCVVGENLAIDEDFNLNDGFTTMAYQISALQTYTAESYQAELDKTQAELAQAVADGQTLAEDAAKILETMTDTLQKIKDGSLTLYYAEMHNSDGTPANKITIQATADAVKDTQFSDASFVVTTH